MDTIKAILASIMGAVGIVYAWLIYVARKNNRLAELMAANIEGDKNRDRAITEIKKDVYSIKEDVKQMRRALTDWKQLNNNTLIRVNKILEELE